MVQTGWITVPRRRRMYAIVCISKTYTRGVRGIPILRKVRAGMGHPCVACAHEVKNVSHLRSSYFVFFQYASIVLALPCLSTNSMCEWNSSSAVRVSVLRLG